MSTPVLQLMALWEAWVTQGQAASDADPTTAPSFHAHLSATDRLPTDAEWAWFSALLAWRNDGDARPLRQVLRQAEPPQSPKPGFDRRDPGHRPLSEPERQMRFAKARSRRRMAGWALLTGLFLLALFGLNHRLREAPVFLAVGALALPGAALLWYASARPRWFRISPATQTQDWARVPELAWVMAGPAWACPAMVGDAAMLEAYTRQVIKSGRII